MTRQEANRVIVAAIAALIEADPSMRFNQILWALDLADGTDRFYAESVTDLERLEQARAWRNGK